MKNTSHTAEQWNCYFGQRDWIWNSVIIWVAHSPKAEWQANRYYNRQKYIVPGDYVQECWSQADWRINLKDFLWERACVLGIRLKFSNVCFAVPMRWAVEMAWTPRRVRSLSWATAESARESGHGGELEKLSVSIIRQEHVDPKNCNYLVISKWLHFKMPLTQLCLALHIIPSSPPLHTHTQKWTDCRHVWKKCPQGFTWCVLKVMWDQERYRYPKSPLTEASEEVHCMSKFLEFPVLLNNCCSSDSCLQLRFMVRGYFPLGSHTPVLYDDYTPIRRHLLT